MLGTLDPLHCCRNSCLDCPSFLASLLFSLRLLGNRYTLSEVESHQPLPEHQQVSSGGALRRSERTFPESPRLNASARCIAV